jgi:hypothetical protein
MKSNILLALKTKGRLFALVWDEVVEANIA